MSDSEQLKKLSRNWKFEPMDQRTWIENQSSRIGVRPGDLERAFKNELSDKQDLSETLEYPDVMKITYKYSYGGQSPFFRALRDYGKLLGAHCDVCNFTYCPPRKDCSRCYGETKWVELPGTGKIETYTTVFKGSSSITGKTPFVCAYIRLDGSDFVVMANVEMDDASLARIGMPVQVVMKAERAGAVTDFFFRPKE